MKSKIIAALGVLTFGLMAGLPFAASASASPAITPGCSTGKFAGSCGTQVTTSTPALGMAASGSVTKPFAGQNTPVLGRSNLSTKASDFYTFAPANGTNNAKVFNYAPNGKRSNFNAAQTRVGGPVVFRKASSSTWQQWIATPVIGSDGTTVVGYTWTNVATGQALTATNQGGQFTAADLGSAAPTSKQTFNFTTTAP